MAFNLNLDRCLCSDSSDCSDCSDCRLWLLVGSDRPTDRQYIQMYSNVFKWVQNLFKCVKCVPACPKLVQLCSKLFKNYQSFQCTGSDMTSRAWSSFSMQYNSKLTNTICAVQHWTYCRWCRWNLIAVWVFVALLTLSSILVKMCPAFCHIWFMFS